MNKEILTVSLRQNAIFIPQASLVGNQKALTEPTTLLVANAQKLGFVFSEALLRALNKINPPAQLAVLQFLKESTGVNKNWTPLVKGWNIPTGESIKDHFITLIANVFPTQTGTTLACGHLIPKNTFPLERYNGCPFCGTPFEAAELKLNGQGSKMKALDLWQEKELDQFYLDLLTSKTALDATQVASLKTLIGQLGLPEKTEIKMKETSMLVIDALVEQGLEAETQRLFKSPNDILRYLWYKHTGFLQIIEPKTIVSRKAKNATHMYPPASQSAHALINSKKDLKLKYTRKECRRVANWLNGLKMEAETACEIMHPKRGMWVRFIRALRLAEYSKRKGFEPLANLLDVFYNEMYDVHVGRINHFRLRSDADNTFALLKQRPGLFARSLFSNMLWFGDDISLAHFAEISDQIPARLAFTLNMYAQTYFNKNGSRTVSPLGGTNKRIPNNPLLQIYGDKELKGMQAKIENMTLEVMKKRFAAIENEGKTIFIEEGLFNIPVSIGDRSETVQDLPSALMGTRFPLEGNTVRLFMEWGKGLKAQALDMDLSCRVAYEDRVDFCSYSQLVTPGCKHSGDIIHIPEQVGTAEYIDIDVKKLASLGAKYVSFTCNAYSNGSITPNLVVGWMDSKYPMKVSAKSGVAYDPSCVQHQVRITQSITKGLVFGVLDVEKREVVWLEMSFGGQVVHNLDTAAVESLLAKLESKLNVGNLLTLKAEAQGLEIVSTKEAADEQYDMKWAGNTAAVTQLLVD